MNQVNPKDFDWWMFLLAIVLILGAWYGANHGWGFWAWACCFMSGFAFSLSNRSPRKTIS